MPKEIIPQTEDQIHNSQNLDTPEGWTQEEWAQVIASTSSAIPVKTPISSPTPFHPSEVDRETVRLCQDASDMAFPRLVDPLEDTEAEVQDITDFINAILPLREEVAHEGPIFYYLAEIDPTKAKDAKDRLSPCWSQTREELIQKAKSIRKNGKNVYVAVSVFSQKERKAEFSLGSKVIHMDRDCGEGKEFPEQKDAWEAIYKASDALGVFPLVIDSGNGLQDFILLDRFVTREEWKKLCLAVAQLNSVHGCKYDTAVVGDAARFMRLPGTRNFRNPSSPKKAQILHHGQRVNVDDLKERLANVRQHKPTEAALPSQAPRKSDTGNDEFLPPPINHPPFSAVEVADNCAQMALMRDTRGNLMEPLWYAGLQVVKFSIEGETLAHEWSEGHPNYSREETDGRLKRLDSMTGPTTCSRFKGLNPSVCESCQFKDKPEGFGPAQTVQKDPLTIFSTEEEAQTESGEAFGDGKKQKDASKSAEFRFVQSLSWKKFGRADKSLYQWTGKFWKLVDEEEIKGEAAQYLARCIPGALTASKISSCANVLASCAPPVPNVPEEESEAVIPLQSGYLHVFASGEVEERPHDPALGIKYCLPISYRPEAPAPQFTKFLHEVLPDESDRATVQEFFGYTLIRSKRFHKGLILDGDGRNGKGVLLNLLKALHYKNATINLDNLRGFGLENSLDASLLSCPELPKKNFDNELFKAIVVEDEIKIDRKFKVSVSASPPGKLVILTNGLPTLTDRSAGFWARLLIIQFKTSFVGREDTGLEKRIRQSELPAILNWAVAGLVRLLQNGKFTEGEGLRKAVDTARLESDPIRLYLHETGAALAEGVRIGKQDLFGRFQMWSENNGFAKCNNVTFWKRIRSIFPDLKEEDRKGGGRQVNIRLNPE